MLYTPLELFSALFSSFFCCRLVSVVPVVSIVPDCSMLFYVVLVV